MAGFTSSPVNYSFATTGSWVDVDVSADVPAGASCAIFLCYHPGGSADNIGWRKKGSTDTFVGQFSANKIMTAFVGLDANRVCQFNIAATTQDIYLIGWIDSADVTMFTNAVDKTPGSTASWVSTDISADTGADTAIGAIWNVVGSTGVAGGVRKTGSTDARIDAIQCGGAICGVNGSELCEINIAATTQKWYLVGYVKSGAVFNTNATDRSLGATGVFTDLTALPAGALAGIYEVISTGATQTFYLRKNGNTDDFSAGNNTRHNWYVVPCDGSQLVEGKINNTAVDFFEVGYFTAGSQSVNLTGVSTTMAAGTLSPTVAKTLTGVQTTTAIGTLGIQALKTLTGVAATMGVGSITPAALVSLLGVQATMAVGALLADTATRVNLTGVQTTMSVGTLAVAAQIQLAGVSTTVDVGQLAWEIALALEGVASTMGVGDFTISDNWTRVATAGGTWTPVSPTSTVWTPVSSTPTTWTPR